MIINTPKGAINLEDCVYKEGSSENDNELIHWQEYWLGEELVKRDVQMHLKKGVFGASELG